MEEPIEEVVIDVDEEHSGVVVQKMSERKAEMIEMRPSGATGCGWCSTADPRLIGYQGELLTDTAARIMNRCSTATHLQGRHPGPPQRRADLQRSGEAVATRCSSWKTRR